MGLTVTLNIFSGRSNPSWTLSEEQAEEVTNRVQKMDEPTGSKPPGVLGGLGYRGFILSGHPSEPAGALSLYVHEGIVDRGQTEINVIDRDRRIEMLLLESAGEQLDADVRVHVQESLKAPAAALSLVAPQAVKCPTCQAADAPSYDPRLWNVPNVQPYNNCYNYANNQITNTFAQPGRAHGKPITSLSCGGVQPSAQADGLNPAPDFSQPLSPGQGWYVAMVIWPGIDYHWYRQDDVGCWSHKPGSTAVRDVDNSGNKITDPRTCDRGPYTDFCTYMVTYKSVVIS